MRTRIRWTLGVVLASIVAVTGASPAIASDAQPEASVTLYLATNGNDSASGSSSAPLKTLKGARNKLATTNSASATILVRPGTYRETAMVDWAGVPQSTVSIRRASGTERPIFDGSAVVGTARYWVNSNGGPSLDVWGLMVRNYRTGGMRLDTDGNSIRNMIFEKIGNRHVSGGPGYAALHLLGSSNNSITNNIFRNLENNDCPGCVHGVYAANGSSDSTISGNTFTTTTGDVIRFRHGTNGNVVTDNVFSRSGSKAINRAFVSFWRFKTSETCGKNNLVTNNTYDGRFYNGFTGQSIAGTGAESGVARCATAIKSTGNVKK